MDRTTADDFINKSQPCEQTTTRKTAWQDYAAFETGRFRGYVHKAYAKEGFSPVLAGILAEPPSSAKVVSRRNLKGEVFGIEFPICGHPQAIFVKCVRFRKSYCRRIFIDTMMPSLAFRYITVAETLRGIGIDTPTVIAVVEEQCFTGIRHRFILTEWCRNTITLKEYGMATAIHDSAKAQAADRKEIIDCFARMVRLLHRNRLFHLDLKPENILLRQEKRCGDPSLILIDLDSAVMGRSETSLSSILLKSADLLILAERFRAITHVKEQLRFLMAYSGSTHSRKRFRGIHLFVLRSPMVFQRWRALRVVPGVHFLKRLLLYLRIVR